MRPSASPQLLFGLGLSFLLLGHAGVAGGRRTTKLSMPFVAGETIHLAGQQGAITRRREGQVDLDLLTDGSLTGADAGTFSEHNLFPTFSTDEDIAWTNRWRGSWTRSTGALRLDLTLADRRCARHKMATGAPPETLPCGAMSAQVGFVCSIEQLAVEQRRGTAEHPILTTAKTPAWVCLPTATVNLADTPSPWVFGKTICVQVREEQPLSYATCPRAPESAARK